MNFAASGTMKLSGFLMLCVVLFGSYITKSNACKVTGFKVWLKSDAYNPMWAGYMGRDGTQDLKQNDLICSSNSVGDNIEAITEGCSSGDVVSFALRNQTGSEDGAPLKMLLQASDDSSPYFLYGNDGTKVLGAILPNGKYRVVAFPQNSKGGRKSVDFQVIDCTYYRPTNECNKCNSQGKVCEGGLCVSRADMRITLLAYGPNTWDYGMNVTTPIGTVISAYPGTHNNQYDPITGGYVDADDQIYGCRSTGVWVKNVVFKNATQIVSGKYIISLEDVSVCGFRDLPLRRSFELKVFRKGKVVPTYPTDPNGKVFSFDM